MLTCKKLVENGSEYLEGDMSRWQRFKYKTHLFMCNSCTQYIKQLKQTISMVRAAPKKEPSEEIQKLLSEEYKEAMEK